MVEEKVEEIKSADDIFEELEQEEMAEIEKIADEVAKEAQKRREELEKFAKEVTIADIIDCLEKIKKFMEVYKEAIRTSEHLRDLFADNSEDPSKAFIKMFMGGRF